MKLVPFTAANADAALAQIQEQLGPEAIVVSVRQLPQRGLARWWQRRGPIEVLAGIPETGRPPVRHPLPAGLDAYVPFGENLPAPEPASGEGPRHWPSIAWLQSAGLLPELAQALEAQAAGGHPEGPPATPTEEWSVVRSILAGHWRPPRQEFERTGRPHVFVGPCGSGKTTVLCKWMTGAVLTRESRVGVWRLDGATANTSEFLSLHAELLGVNVQRFWSTPREAADLWLVDLPGIEAHDPTAREALGRQLADLPQPHVHLVLNAACETRILLEQIEHFRPLDPEDLVFTHLDEAPQRVKLWNFVLGTDLPLSFLSAGQKIPGDFCRAESGSLFPREKPLK